VPYRRLGYHTSSSPKATFRANILRQAEHVLAQLSGSRRLRMSGHHAHHIHCLEKPAELELQWSQLPTKVGKLGNRLNVETFLLSK
jgi:hypothetical protein